MLTQFKNTREKLQGEWQCTSYSHQLIDNKEEGDFKLHIVNDIISCKPQKEGLWPAVSQFELVGSDEAGYFIREDGCFFQFKDRTEDMLQLELTKKNEDGTISTFIFEFELIK